ncbi:MAG: hypothetical protein FD180_22 [Planctomycetota bacterium]|nr:MAG: hypothetical protein FD180_22 [Planctomycetota bacterium]
MIPVKLRRCSPFVVAAFLAAHLSACACTFSSVPRAAESKAKPEGHGCCTKKSPDEPQPSKPVKSSCCCDDPSHFAVQDEPTVGVKSPVVEVPVDLFLDAVRTGADRYVSDVSPPGRAPDVPLYTLHASLLI